MNKITSVEQYLAEHADWKELISTLRSIIARTELAETIKWGAPTYTLNGKNVVAIGAFKEHVALWFFNGVFLTDPHNTLVNAQNGKTKGLRQLRYSTPSELEESIVTSYVEEAIENEKQGKRVKVERNKELIIPEELQSALQENETAKEQFSSLSLSKQREYADHIASAKREETKLKRLSKVLPMIEQGIGLNDKYRNC